MATEDIRLDGRGDLRAEPEELLEPEHPGGGRFNRLILIAFVAVAIVSGVVVALGVESSGIGRSAALQKAVKIPAPRHATAERSRTSPRTAASHSQHRPSCRLQRSSPACKRRIQQAPPRPPSRYAQWAEEKYMKALEAPQMVAAFHGGGTLEIARAKGQQSTNFNTGTSTDPTVTLHPPASPYTVMAGSVIPAVL